MKLKYIVVNRCIEINVLEKLYEEAHLCLELNSKQPGYEIEINLNR